MNKNINTIMSIAGSDSGGGAGIQADLKTIAALGGYGTTVITALTAQNTLGVDGVLPVSPDFIESQFNAIAADFDVRAVKTGMLPNRDVVCCVAELLKRSNINHFVLDPVMVSTSGAALSTEGVLSALLFSLIPQATILTPNIYEAEALLGRSISTLEGATEAAIDLLSYGSEAVIIKGGHLELGNPGEIIDVFISKGRGNGKPVHYIKPKIITENLHGTGCTLSAALATLLAAGLSPLEAFYEAQVYISGAIAAGANLQLGKGHGPLWHF